MVVEQSGDSFFLYVINLIKVVKNYFGKDCVFCYQVFEGMVFGIVSMKVLFDFVEVEVFVFWFKIGGVVVVVLGVLLVIIYLLINYFVIVLFEYLCQGLCDIVSGEGDLMCCLLVNGNDEVGQLVKVFNEMMENFN